MVDVWCVYTVKDYNETIACLNARQFSTYHTGDAQKGAIFIIIWHLNIGSFYIWWSCFQLITPDYHINLDTLLKTSS